MSEGPGAVGPGVRCPGAAGPACPECPCRPSPGQSPPSPAGAPVSVPSAEPALPALGRGQRQWKFGRREGNMNSPGVTSALGGCLRCIPSFSVKFIKGAERRSGCSVREALPGNAAAAAALPLLGAGLGHIAVPQFPCTARKELLLLSHGCGHHLALHRCGIRGSRTEQCRVCEGAGEGTALHSACPLCFLSRSFPSLLLAALRCRVRGLK